jgi:hypothetical protein
MTGFLRIRYNDHLQGAPVPDAMLEDCIWSPQALAEELQDATVLAIPLPALSEAERAAGLVAGWKRTITCQTKAVGDETLLAETREEWVLGKWQPSDWIPQT